MPATIFDVARLAGVSISTVSRVLNGHDRVHPQTRQSVQDAIRQLDYEQAAPARTLATRRSEMLGLVIPQVNDPFYYQIVRGVEDATSAAGFSLLIASQPRHEGIPRNLKPFRRRFVDGLVVVAIDVAVAEVQELLDRGVPLVLVQMTLGEQVSAFTVDNYCGARALVEHLLFVHGYRRFAYIAGSNHTPDNAERLCALRNTLDEHGLALPSEYIVQGDYLRGSGYAAMQRLLALDELPDVVFAANDQMASDAMLALRAHHLCVPEDIAVVGFDDVHFASYVMPPLTTVHQPSYELGFQAAQATLQAAQHEKPVEPVQTVLPTRLVVRQSCGCA
jgi:DNA-binding LacI/PurR family transcriptional regulator